MTTGIFLAALLVVGTVHADEPPAYDDMAVYPQPTEGENLSACTTTYFLRLYFAYRTSLLYADLALKTGVVDIGPVTQTSEEQEEKKRDILQWGYVTPRIFHDQPENRIPPSMFLNGPSVQKMCCKQTGPINTWWCIYERPS